MLFALQYQTWYQNDDKTQYIYQVAQYVNSLIQIFMNIRENIGNKRKVAEKLREYIYKITHISAAYVSLNYQTWF